MKRAQAKETLLVLLRELEDEAAPLVMGAIQMGLATAEGLLQRGSLQQMLAQSACQDDVVRAIFDHIIAALSNEETAEFEDLLDEIEQLVALARARQRMQ